MKNQSKQRLLRPSGLHSSWLLDKREDGEKQETKLLQSKKLKNLNLKKIIFFKKRFEPLIFLLSAYQPGSEYFQVKIVDRRVRRLCIVTVDSDDTKKQYETLCMLRCMLKFYGQVKY